MEKYKFKWRSVLDDMSKLHKLEVEFQNDSCNALVICFLRPPTPATFGDFVGQ